MHNARPFVSNHRRHLMRVAMGLMPVMALVGCDRDNGAKSGDTSTTAASEAKRGREMSGAPVTPAGETPRAPAPQAAPVPDWKSRLDSDMKKVIDELGTLGGKPIETLTAAEARKQPSPADAVKSLLRKSEKSVAPEEVGKVEDRKIKGAAGEIPIRIYTPKSGKAPFPLVVYYHGGGFVIADLDTYDSSPRALANAVGAVVVSADYRHGPENKFPAAHDDAFAAYKWVLQNAASLGGDAARVAVVGESAGGNLAANVVVMARDGKVRVPLHAVLVYPIAANDMTTASYLQFAEAKPLNKPMMEWFNRNYFKAPTDKDDLRINLVAANLSGFPPTTVINAEIDPLATEGELLAKKLTEAGAKVTQKTYQGVTHEFFGMGAVVGDAKDAMKLAADGLKDSFAERR